MNSIVRDEVFEFIGRMRQRMASGGNVPYSEFSDVLWCIQKQIDRLSERLEEIESKND